MSHVIVPPLSNTAFSDVYPERPIWAIASGISGSTMLLVFGTNPYINMSFEQSGASGLKNSKIRAYSDELQASNYYFTGNTGTQQTAEGFAPSTGFWGSYCFGNTACLMNLDVHSNGSWGFYNGLASSDVVTYSSTVIGSSIFCQNYDLFNRNNTVSVDYIGGAGAYLTDSTSFDDKTSLTALSGWQSPASPQPTNYGMMSYNRNTNKIAVLENGADGLSYRLHIISLGTTKITADITNTVLKSLIATAVSAGSPTYKYYNLTFPSDTNYNTSLETRYKIKMVLCDDDTLWFVRNDTNGSSTSPSPKLILYSIATSLTNVATNTTVNPTTISSFTNAAVSNYSVDTNSVYGMRHMNSDDNSRIAIYAPFSYGNGIRMFIVNTATATVGNYMTFGDGTSTGGNWSIAPAGDKKFALSMGGFNGDSFGARVHFVDSAILGAASKTVGNTAQGYYPIPSTSTLYGGFFVCKVQPLKDTKV